MYKKKDYHTDALTAHLSSMKKSHICKARPCLWSWICQLQALPVPNRGCRARKQMQLCFLMQLNPKLSMEAGKILSAIG